MTAPDVDGDSSAPQNALDLRGIGKRYGSTIALHEVDLKVRRGEIHALVGGNGSGKSTLIKGLCGVIGFDAGGTVSIDGISHTTSNWSKATARSAGIHAVHQDLGVFLDMTVAENFALGERFSRNRIGAIAWSATYARAAALIERFSIDADPDTSMRSLSPANRTLVAIARAVQDGAHDRGLLILDEPTASLPQQESDHLLDTLQRYAQAGQSILYISHRLDEILRAADRVSALRDGRYAGTHDNVDLTEDDLVQLIVGTDLPGATTRSTRRSDARPVLELSGVTTGPLTDVDLTLQPGEIVGLAGVVGSGRSTLLRSIFGARTFDHGSMRLLGTPTRLRNCRQAIRAGIAYVAEDRAHDAAFADLTITANVGMPVIDQYRSPVGIRDRALRERVRQLMGEFLVKAPNSEALLSTLSGGNQQKVVLARWLNTKPKLLLLDEPSQGVDVGARAEIHSLIRRAADQGTAVLVAASDPNELALLVDRALVLRDGRISVELSGLDLTADRLAIEMHRGHREAA